MEQERQMIRMLGRQDNQICRRSSGGRKTKCGNVSTRGEVRGVTMGGGRGGHWGRWHVNRVRSMVIRYLCAEKGDVFTLDLSVARCLILLPHIQLRYLKAE
jgi:hypothetical protein